MVLNFPTPLYSTFFSFEASSLRFFVPVEAFAASGFCFDYEDSLCANAKELIVCL